MRTLTLSVDAMRCRRCVRQATALVRDVAVVQAVLAVGVPTASHLRGTIDEYVRTNASVEAQERGTRSVRQLGPAARSGSPSPISSLAMARRRRSGRRFRAPGREESRRSPRNTYASDGVPPRSQTDRLDPSPPARSARPRSRRRTSHRGTSGQGRGKGPCKGRHRRVNRQRRGTSPATDQERRRHARQRRQENGPHVAATTSADRPRGASHVHRGVLRPEEQLTVG
jgi:hypothetical protein